MLDWELVAAAVINNVKQIIGDKYASYEDRLQGDQYKIVVTLITNDRHEDSVLLSNKTITHIVITSQLIAQIWANVFNYSYDLSQEPELDRFLQAVKNL